MRLVHEQLEVSEWRQQRAECTALLQVSHIGRTAMDRAIHGSVEGERSLESLAIAAAANQCLFLCLRLGTILVSLLQQQLELSELRVVCRLRRSLLQRGADLQTPHRRRRIRDHVQMRHRNGVSKQHTSNAARIRRAVLSCARQATASCCRADAPLFLSLSAVSFSFSVSVF